jgi:hypothetical protein
MVRHYRDMQILKRWFLFLIQFLNNLLPSRRN